VHQCADGERHQHQRAFGQRREQRRPRGASYLARSR
jgi:hypothetical protein